MKKLYVCSRNHMDLSWRRCFEKNFRYRDAMIRPYAQIEAQQINQHLDMGQKSGYVYSIEQAASVQKFLEMFPDRKDEFADAVKKGTIELLGGGYAAIDTNMVSGESLYRNHYYGIRFYKTMFGIRPDFADYNDIFGLSAQLPQILKQFGYDAICYYSRVFENHKPFWRGLNGDILLLQKIEDFQDSEFGYGMYMPPCPVCNGEGCQACEETGLDISYKWFDQSVKNRLNDLLQEWSLTDKQEYILHICSEEGLHSDTFTDELWQVAQSYGFEVIFSSQADIIRHMAGDKLNCLKSGTYALSEIDSRLEGNPMATGCYTSRIWLKQENRRLEQLLYSAEALAALNESTPYPARKLELLWNKLGLIQFHDCITASHSDGSYEELQQICSEIRLGGTQILNEAMRDISAKIDLHGTSNGNPVIVFNTCGSDFCDVPVKLVLKVPQIIQAIELFDMSGQKIKTVSFVCHQMLVGAVVEVEALINIPSFGYRILFWKESQAQQVTQSVQRIENQYYIVDEQGVFDKRLGRVIIATVPGSLMLSDDIGHPWGRTESEKTQIFLQDTLVSGEKSNAYQSLIFEGEYQNKDLHVNSLSWKRTITLYDGIDKVFIKTTLNWAGKDCHLYADFPLTFDNGDFASYEVPFGFVRRGRITEPSTKLGIEDEWPALNWFGCFDEQNQTSVIVYNKGLPGCRVQNGHMQVSLLRSPTRDDHCAQAIEGSIDCGEHVYELCLQSCRGNIEDINPAAFGQRLNACIGVYQPSADNSDDEFVEKQLLCMDTKNTIVSAIKRNDSGRLVVRLYEPIGRTTHIKTNGTVYETDPLEIIQKRVDSLFLEPFEIKTIMMD